MLAGGLRANDRPGSSRRVWNGRPWPAGERLWTRGVIISAITKNMPPKKSKNLKFLSYISSKKAKFETIFVRGKECLIHPDAVLLA